MTDRELRKYIEGIQPPDPRAMERARARQLSLAKPPGSLGRLEDIAVRLSGISGLDVYDPRPACVTVFCADNGVTEEGVSSAPRSVTLAQAVNMTKGLTGMSSMAKHFGDLVTVVDVGIDASFDCPRITDRKIARGTADIAKGPAMTKDQALAAVRTGIEMASLAKKQGVRLLGCGEMGIGNTTTSSAVLSVLTGLEPEQVTGRGGGLTDGAFARKKQVIRRAIELNRPDPMDPLDTLSKLGGFDLAAMCGFYLGAANERLPVVVDGFISVVAALCAFRLCGACAGYMFPSHSSFEPGYRAAAREIGLEPFLDLGMRLGEGSGCVPAFRIIEAACAFTAGMASFAEASIDDAYLEEIRKGDHFTV